MRRRWPASIWPTCFRSIHRTGARTTAFAWRTRSPHACCATSQRSAIRGPSWLLRNHDVSEECRVDPVRSRVERQSDAVDGAEIVYDLVGAGLFQPERSEGGEGQLDKLRRVHVREESKRVA